VALALAGAGAAVVVNGHRDRNAVDAVVQEIRAAGGRALGVMADVASHDAVAEMVAQAVAEFGSVDIAISNVGIRRMQIPVGRFGDVAEVAAACAFLASEGGGFVSGQVIHVNGGHYMY
jgi:3-oxoacyl-[acyl-carrier protein] reductase